MLAILALTLTGCSGRRTIVKVNGEKVTKNDFYNRLQAVPVQTPQGPQMAGRYVMQQIISEKLVQQLADDQKVKPTEAQINKKIDFIKKQSGNLGQVLKQRGMSLDDLKRQITIEQSFINVVTKGVKITDEQAKKAYDQAMAAKPSPFIRPEAVMVSGIIVANKAKCDKAYGLLQGGTEFSAVAAEYNDDPGIKKNNGRLNWVTKDDPRLPPQIRNTAFALTPGKYSAPFKVQNTWVILRADSRRPKRITPYDEVKDMIKEQLAIQEGTKKGTFRKEMQKFAKAADIQVKHPAYKDIAEKIKKEAAANVPQTAGAEPGAATTQPAATGGR
jgi:foldase protein PrsA